MSKKFKMNHAGVRDLMRSEDMQAILREKAEAIKARAGDGYEMDIHVGKNRANAMVWAESFEAKKETLKSNTLLKAVRG